MKPPADTLAPDILTNNATNSKSFDYLDDALEQAELDTQVRGGKRHPHRYDIRNSIFQARTARSNGWNDGTAANVLSALTALAVYVFVVTNAKAL